MAKRFYEEQPAAEERAEEEVVVAPVAKAVEAPQPMKLDFDAWWALREKKVPQHHMKEIILADFKARKLSLKETMSTYDEALRKYGVKLK